MKDFCLGFLLMLALASCVVSIGLYQDRGHGKIFTVEGHCHNGKINKVTIK